MAKKDIKSNEVRTIDLSKVRVTNIDGTFAEIDCAKDVRTIDLSKVRVTNIDGTFAEIDCAKDVASVTYRRTDSLAVASACMELFKTGKCEWSEEVANELKDTASQLARVTADGQLESVGIIFKKAIIDAIG